MSFPKKALFLYVSIVSLFVIPQSIFAMHIMEGFLPVKWAIVWFVIAIPFVALGLFEIGRMVKINPKIKILLGVIGAFAFVLSALKIPSVTGSCSHPTGTGLGAILFGPFIMAPIGMIVLLFQTLLLAHGGLTTLGANTFSMAIAGPIFAYAVFKLFDFMKSPKWLSVFTAAFLGDLLTYVVTSFQLSVAFPGETGGILGSLVKFLTVFAVTQLPLAVSEGILTVIIYNVIAKYNGDDLKLLKMGKENV